MQPRPRIPFQGGMGPRMMGPGQMRGPYGGGGQRMMGAANPFGGGNQMMGSMMGRPPGRSGGGGILSKLLGGNKQAMGALQGIQGAARNSASGGSGGGIGSILQTLSKPDGLSGFLNNTQQVLQTAQSFGPMIQQYGPLVKNLPAMWKLYKGLKDSPSEDQPKESTTVAVDKDESSETTSKGNKKAPQTSSPETKEKRKQGTSIPKLYI
ncbi:VrrA/YqfQ family protein [Bacillus sp. MRMR6]|uniref:VrrA/YqfQ family protein n=1 Tax=Bacillus sp. MRMR6 TaxID=1928617 RepID=UPI000950D783|nr:VrrA/YqfQ family protein [Bacillus sp. MRMR6]OLS41665.1 hypothetical protein BTR25_03715 [Bacillus sp. MRMR6]